MVLAVKEKKTRNIHIISRKLGKETGPKFFFTALGVFLVIGLFPFLLFITAEFFNLFKIFFFF